MIKPKLYFYLVGRITIVFILVGLCFLMGCMVPNSPSSKFHPPSWIIGSWQNDVYSTCYTFTNDNIILSGGNDINFKVDFKNDTVNESISSTNYEVTIRNNIYSFTKVSDTTLAYSIAIGGDPPLDTIQLSKQ